MTNWKFDGESFICKKSHTEYRSKKTVNDRIDMVIECLATGTDDEDAYMTEQEIGEYLGYKPNPRAIIALIHANHDPELDPFIQKRTILVNGRTREEKFYSPRGVAEVMRYSRKEKKNEFFERLREKTDGGTVQRG